MKVVDINRLLKNTSRRLVRLANPRQTQEP